MKHLKTIAAKLCSCFTLLLLIKNISIAQSCNGTWSLQRPATFECVTGQWIGWQNLSNPLNCPQTPTYSGTQSNTFTFTTPVTGFSVDFVGIDGTPGCPRISISVNGLFYQLFTSNLSDLPEQSICVSGSFSNITLTNDGYITESGNGGNGFLGRGRIVLSNINAENFTVSTNDGNGTVFSNPFNCVEVLPLQLNSFNGINTLSCKAQLVWTTEIEEKIKNIEVQRSDSRVIFETVAEVLPMGNNSTYTLQASNEDDGYFRLKINDIDGNYEYSKIIRVKSDCNKSSYSITPNPSTGIMNITGLSGNEKILIYDMAGRNVLSFAEPFTNRYNINKLSGGLYVVAIFEGKICKAQLKLVKTGFD